MANNWAEESENIEPESVDIDNFDDFTEPRYNKRATRYNSKEHSSSIINSTVESDNPNKNEDQTDEEPHQLTQEELTDMLTCKLRERPSVKIDTLKKTGKNGDYFYSIKAFNGNLKYYGDVFFSGIWQTVSHNARCINISLIFNDNEERNADMMVNADAIIAILRNIAPTTFEDIHLKQNPDARGNIHLYLTAGTVRGASLIYTYSKTIQFIKIVNQKYGTIPDYAAKRHPHSIDSTTEESNEDNDSNATTIKKLLGDGDIQSRRTQLLEELAKLDQQLKEQSLSERTPIETHGKKPTTNMRVVIGGKVVYKNTKNKSKYEPKWKAREADNTAIHEENEVD
jgi:hypothetical protein